MAVASIIFWLICAIPLIGGVYWLIRKDKNKMAGSWGLIILTVLIIAAFLVIIYVTKDFDVNFQQTGK
ncbi:hypothetical protein C7T94_16700 [Pedobacter yulinensis]|uniref:Uncharacterized protein n=1 Tax=Pedobacter yulinensis TaxID=2126353 RepID=A0A2T3HJ48_9SPHI|nr:hypothetical protein [Pedobacter yulinensis]PST82411.1 hypothetical protein C7T94_16700 [Pedobacter yulinensis]